MGLNEDDGFRFLGRNLTNKTIEVLNNITSTVTQVLMNMTTPITNGTIGEVGDSGLESWLVGIIAILVVIVVGGIIYWKRR